MHTLDVHVPGPDMHVHIADSHLRAPDIPLHIPNIHLLGAIGAAKLLAAA